MFKSEFIRRHLKQGMKFAIAGGAGSIIDLSTLTLFVELFNMPKWLAGIPSTLLAVIVVFLLNKHFTFQDREKNYAHQAFKFALVYGAAILFNILCYNFFLWLQIHYILSKVLAIGIGAVWNYSLSHGFVFKKREQVDTVVV
ncbi:MAG: GtrA family protein [Candidatus Peregrinibacteria bacterium]|nr:GtrA family protein [Candidatus Peregrinibacteria bacterium]